MESHFSKPDLDQCRCLSEMLKSAHLLAPISWILKTPSLTSGFSHFLDFRQDFLYASPRID